MVIRVGKATQTHLNPSLLASLAAISGLLVRSTLDRTAWTAWSCRMDMFSLLRLVHRITKDRQQIVLNYCKHDADLLAVTGEAWWHTLGQWINYSPSAGWQSVWGRAHMSSQRAPRLSQLQARHVREEAPVIFYSVSGESSPCGEVNGSTPCSSAEHDSTLRLNRSDIITQV